MLERLFALEFFGIKLGLENILQLCDALNHPERSFIPLHIAGTNGKGSVTAMTHEALLAAGIRSARYTSPHLVDLRERFVIGDAAVDPATLEAVAGHVLDCADRLRDAGILAVTPTFFEATTAIAFELFRRAGVDAAVIEVGLGGRYDATNVLEARLGAITSIGFDHQQYLGHTLEEIAFEKAGIIKSGMTLVTGAMPLAAEAVVAKAARERSARHLRAADDCDVRQETEAGVTTITVHTPHGEYGPVPLALRGEHQIGNALVAIRLLEEARLEGLVVPRTAIETGLSAFAWPARLETIAMPDGRELIIDAAHNIDGARALAAYLGRWHPDGVPLVVGIMGDKDVDGVLRALLPVSTMVVATQANIRRACPAPELAELVRALAPTRQVQAVSDPMAAVDLAFEHGDVVCVAGSIFLAGAVREGLKQRAILHVDH